ncbi:MAG: hypothetical protein HN368_10340 [Spirochaetales bacterium]|jgi:hypothetical protein|nr:hypothetical protein [Spirochaetales bacterium]
MTSKQRLLAAARREEVDTIPIAPRLGFASTIHFGQNDIIAHLRLKSVYDFDPQFILSGNNYPFFSPYSAFQENDRVGIETSITDLGRTKEVRRVFSTPDGKLSEVFIVPKPGSAEYGESPNPSHTEYLVKESADLKRLRYLLPPTDHGLAEQYQNTAAVVGDEGLCLATVYGALDHQAGSVMAMEDIMVAVLTDPSFAAELIDLFQRQLITQTKALLEAGVRYFFCPYYYHSLSAGWSPAIFAKWFLPLIKEQADLIHEYDGLMFYYDDGRHMGILPFLTDAQVDVVETCTPPPVGDFDLIEAKRMYGKDITFKGFVDLIYVLQKGTVDDVQESVRFACETGGKGFILGTSDSMRSGTPRENIDAYFQYGREFGKQ